MKNNTSYARVIKRDLFLPLRRKEILIIALAIFLLIPSMSADLREENNNLIKKGMDLGTNLVSNQKETINNSEGIVLDQLKTNPFLAIGIVIAIILGFLFFKLYRAWSGDLQ